MDADIWYTSSQADSGRYDDIASTGRQRGVKAEKGLQHIMFTHCNAMGKILYVQSLCLFYWQCNPGKRSVFLLEAGGCEVGQFREKLFLTGRGQQQVQGDLVRVVRFCAADLLLPQPVLHRGQQVVADGDSGFLKRSHLEEDGFIQSEHGGMAVGTDESASTELDAAKVAGYNYDDIGQSILVNGFEDWIPRGTAGLAVIVGFLLIRQFAQYPGGTVMSGVKVAFFHRLDESTGVFLVFNMADVGDEAA